MGREGVSDEMGGVTNGKVHAFGGAEVQLLDQLALTFRQLMVTVGVEFDVICVEEAVC